MDAAAAPVSGPISERPTRYDVLVPVKDAGRAKTRLAAHRRPALVRAFALDAVAAALPCDLVRAVHVVSSDAALLADAVALGAHPLPDQGGGDLNRALTRAAATLTGGPVAAMLGDLPCLVSADLDAALVEASRVGDAFVPDADGTGTTLVACTGPLRVRFGPGSRAAHVAAGLVEVAAGAATVRRDVDTLDDLEQARALGLGPRTRAVLEAG